MSPPALPSAQLLIACCASCIPAPHFLLRSDTAQVFVTKTNETIGSQYLKAVYRQYTDDTFTTKVQQQAMCGGAGQGVVVATGVGQEAGYRQYTVDTFTCVFV